MRKTSAEQRASLFEVVSAELPHLGQPMRDLLDDLERAEGLIHEMRTSLHPQLTPYLSMNEQFLRAEDAEWVKAVRAYLQAVEQPAIFPIPEEGSGCLHPDWEWDTDRLHPVRVCTTCGEEGLEDVG